MSWLFVDKALTFFLLDGGGGGGGGEWKKKEKKVQLSSTLDGICMLSKAIMHCTLPLRSFPSVAFETLWMFV